METETGNSWRDVLTRIRVRTQSVPKYDLSKYWRIRGAMESEEESVPLTHAAAFQSVLQNLPLYLYPGELITGSSFSFIVDELPAQISSQSYQQALQGASFFGHRDFIGGYDHSLADYSTLLTIGIDGYIQKTKDTLNQVENQDQITYLQAVGIVFNAFKEFILRWAAAALEKGRTDQAILLRAIAGPPPTTLHQAMQLVWMTHLVFTCEERHHMALGRIDQYLYPFYCSEKAKWVKNPTTTSSIETFKAHILNLFCHMWVRLEEIGEVQNICIGGLTPAGEDATNELSYICLEATRLVQSPYTNLSARFHDQSPLSYHYACIEVFKTGIGFPAIFNDHILIPALVQIGIPIEVARDYCMVGCIETMLPGRQPPWSDSRFNLLLCVSDALDYFNQKYINFDGQEVLTYDMVFSQFERILSQKLQEHVQKVNNAILSYTNDLYPDLFLSGLTRFCIDRGQDFHSGGAEFERFHGIAGMGLASAADSLAAVKKLVFEEKKIAFSDLITAIQHDFHNYSIIQQQLLHHAPKYGNGDPYVDDIAAKIVNIFTTAVLEQKIPNRGQYVPLLAANIQNISAGKEVKATPDGRNAFTPLSDAASPYFGRDLNGPTAFIESVSRPNYLKTVGGTVINIKFDPVLFEGEAGTKLFSIFTQTFVEKRIPQFQFNFTGIDTLLAAQVQPELYHNLIVRVSGFSAYFVYLEEKVQNDVIRRTAHGKM
jgi:formate C-acetyltransferase